MPNQATDTRQDRQNPNSNETTLSLIDGATDAARRAAHACGDPAARRHFEYAIALITEAWIAEDGQPPRTALQVVDAVTEGYALINLAFGKESK